MARNDSENDENVERISLFEASQSAPGILARGDSLQLDEGAPPTLNDLAGALQFALGDGRIWLSDERIVLMQTHVLGVLRARMVNEIGTDRARAVFMKIGWEEGVKLAELVKKRFSQDDLTAALAAGPRLHTMEGYAKVVTKRFEFDASKKKYHGEFYWFDSVEGSEHFRHFGISDSPACWMQTAVPSGYSTTLLGFPVIFRELECVAQGANRCVVIGRDAESWGDDVPELELFDLKETVDQESQFLYAPSVTSRALNPVAKPADEIVGNSPIIQRTIRLVDKVVAFAEPVMLLGEPGTGKAHFASYLHKRGMYSNGPFITVNCSALADNAGSQDGPVFGDEGYLKQAEGGTLFLNDFVQMPMAVQSTLAALLKDWRTEQPAFRVVAATGVSPTDAVAQGQLRADLHFYLSVLPIQIPPLRERRDDLPDLIQHFFDHHMQRHSKPLEGLSGAVFDMLLRYDYPGNLRELSNLIDRGIIYAEPGGQIEINHIFSIVEKAPEMARRFGDDGDVYKPKSLADVHRERTLEEVEIDAIRHALLEHDWNISAAARALGLTRAKLDYRVKKLKLFQS